MKRRLQVLIDEKQNLQTQLVQIQSMLHLIDYHISQELLEEVEREDEPDRES